MLHWHIETIAMKLCSSSFLASYCKPLNFVRNTLHKVEGTLFHKMCAIPWQFIRSHVIEEHILFKFSFHKLSRATLPRGTIKKSVCYMWFVTMIHKDGKWPIQIKQCAA
jgi:hypothetical protein